MYEAGGFLDKCQPFLSLSLPVVFSHLSQHTSETSERRPFPDPAGLSLHPSRRPPSPRGTLLPQHHPHVLPRVSVDDPVPTRVREAGASPVYLLSISEISPRFAFPTPFVCHPRAHGAPSALLLRVSRWNELPRSELCSESVEISLPGLSPQLGSSKLLQAFFSFVDRMYSSY